MDLVKDITAGVCESFVKIYLNSKLDSMLFVKVLQVKKMKKSERSDSKFSCFILF